MTAGEPRSSSGDRTAAGPDLDDLLRRTAGGDRDAFTRLYEAVCRPVVGLVTAVVRDAAQAEEVAQEVLVEVWRTAGRFRSDRGSAMTWVLTLAHRRAVDRVRSARAAGERERRSAVRDWERPYDEVAEEVERHLEHERVGRCLAELSRAQRECLVLAYYAGLTHREVAAALTQPLGTVKARLRSGLRLLGECLGRP
ncbi:ECF RNA polymerase sigma factor SigK [Streptomyces bambusae]|uniref:ECF RNA polymerase sigma factor SigK n=1 Tax=Streptomyces bambusae TaxID=1550616 RepID=UPI001CFF1516|nr:ECF RNA polymerase sigma factor SigK [Streptomyces bambusae]MCB5167539.1 ECF RNA polymerase sigma factor SigK [Streptomyces bambusae]